MNRFPIRIFCFRICHWSRISRCRLRQTRTTWWSKISSNSIKGRGLEALKAVSVVEAALSAWNLKNLKKRSSFQWSLQESLLLWQMLRCSELLSQIHSIDEVIRSDDKGTKKSFPYKEVFDEDHGLIVLCIQRYNWLERGGCGRYRTTRGHAKDILCTSRLCGTSLPAVNLTDCLCIARWNVQEVLWGEPSGHYKTC